MKEKYKLEVRCGNCRWAGKLEITKGHPLIEQKCPECGCVAYLKIDDRPVVTSTFDGTEIRIPGGPSIR